MNLWPPVALFFLTSEVSPSKLVSFPCNLLFYQKRSREIPWYPLLATAFNCYVVFESYRSFFLPFLSFFLLLFSSSNASFQGGSQKTKCFMLQMPINSFFSCCIYLDIAANNVDFRLINLDLNPNPS